jgi:glycosyltransferase involved in cell wall biosynthesis
MKECYRLLKDEVLVCPSKFLRDVFIRFGYDQHNLCIIPHGVETARFKPSFKFTDTLLWVGRITPLKGLEYFAKAADVIKMRHASARFVVIGKLASNGMYTYKRMPLTSAIEFVGESSREKLVEYYSNSLALVMTSVWPEPFGITALEAMASGKPVIAFASGGLSEIIVDGETGFLVRRRDHLALADKIMTLLEDRALAMKMGANARRLVEKNYTLKGMCESYEKLYVNML